MILATASRVTNCFVSLSPGVGFSLLFLLFSSTLAHAACEPAARQASFYMDANFQGRCVIKNVGDYPNSNAIGLPNDFISSARVGADTQVILCKDNDFKGDCILLDKDRSFINDPQVGNDAVSSIKVQPLGTNQCVPSPNQASFFVNANYLGQCVVKDIGDYPSSGAIGLPNDSISSIKVGANAQTVVCKDNNFGGDCILVTGDIPLLSGDRVGNDQISSAKVQRRGASACVPGPNQASFFVDADFLGQCVVKNFGAYPTSEAIGLPNDSISSVRIGPGSQAVVCKDVNYGGDCILITSDVRFLTGDRVGNDAITSLKVQPRGMQECEPGAGQASFFQHADFLAPCSALSAGSYPSPQSLGLPERSISGIKLGQGAIVCAYLQNNFAGQTTPINTSTPFLGNLNDSIYSAKIQAAGQPCVDGAVAPQITLTVAPFPPNLGANELIISGSNFQPAEIVRLQISIRSPGNNPAVDIVTTPADAHGIINFTYTGSGGGLCGGGQHESFVVQGTGLTSAKVSNAAQAGC